MSYGLSIGWALLAMGLQGSPTELAPSLDAEQLAALSALPASTTLAIGGSSHVILAEDWAKDARIAVDERVAQATGLSGAGVVESFVGGCTEAGCAVLVTGALKDLSLDQIQQGNDRVVVHGDSLDAIGDSGAWYRLRLLAGGQRVAFGHAAAVDRLLSGEARLDPTPLAAQIPDGDVWLYAHDQEMMAAQLAQWAQTRSAQRELVVQLQAVLAHRPRAARHITGVAVSLDATPTARLRLTCDSPGAARAVKFLLRTQATRAALRSGSPGLPDQNLYENIQIVRVGHQVEATFTPPTSLLQRLLR